MPSLLLATTPVTCSHEAPVVPVPGVEQTVLKVNGVPVAVLPMYTGATVTGCPQQPVPCATAAAPLTGISTALRVNGQPALLLTLTGLTNAGTYKAQGPPSSVTSV
ncbi:hypothetical protein [Streptomyces yaizuensis]|uniref:Uncharacterized protein n=1 Tax=Streptomyces yaizuensis TaxID=2989713 RepID=A0ABQ5NY50_9ACTN|nr:hypothetical protein [Streptomyces sp. YSPA8]GLF95281.1 hypothetical protein SYYSPA8_13310 [Streptomyces sp. YSPA8]